MKTHSLIFSRILLFLVVVVISFMSCEHCATGMALSKQATGGPHEAGNSSPARAIQRAEPYIPSVLPGNDIDGQMMYGYDYAVQQALRIR